MKATFLLICLVIGIVLAMVATGVWLPGGARTDYAAIAAEKDAPYMILSAETNSLKSGVWIENLNHVVVVQNGKVVNQVNLVMLNTATNEIDFWQFGAAPDLAYEIKLTDSDGNAVLKTAYGKKFGRVPEKNPENMPVSSRRQYGLSAGGVLPRGEVVCGGTHEARGVQFDPIRDVAKCFEMEKPGNYKLTLIHRVYLTEHRANGYFLKPVTFSPVTVAVRVEK